jgi:hypothetical protein
MHGTERDGEGMERSRSYASRGLRRESYGRSGERRRETAEPLALVSTTLVQKQTQHTEHQTQTRQQKA